MRGADYYKWPIIATFRVETSGPEERWEVEMRRAVDCSKPYIVVSEPFSGRLMWFEDNEIGATQANAAFASMVQLAMIDADPDKCMRVVK